MNKDRLLQTEFEREQRKTQPQPPPALNDLCRSIRAAYLASPQYAAQHAGDRTPGED